jgi:hypothetical protein
MVKKGGRVYNLIDSLNHTLNNTHMNMQESYSVNFDTFRKNINENVEEVKIKAVQSWNPGAKACNLEVVNAKSIEHVEKHEPHDLEQLIQDDPAIKIAYEKLQNQRKEITKKSLAFELKSMLDNDDIIKTEFKNALQKIDKLEETSFST